jgi:hypothetical protein
MVTEPKEDLTDRMDELARRLLTAVQGAARLEEKLAVLQTVGQWIAIKHEIRGRDDGGDDLAEYRKRLRGARADKAPKRRGFQDDTPEQQRARIMRRWHPGSDSNSTDGDGGPELEALKARLPR